MCNLVIDPIDVLEVKVPVYISQIGHMPTETDQNPFFSIRGILPYDPICDDFCPMDFCSIARFVRILDGELLLAQTTGASGVIFCADRGARNLANAAFLLGAYLIIKCGKPADFAWRALQSLREDRPLEELVDAANSASASGLSILDCLAGVARAAAAGWIAAPTPADPSRWGMLDDAECASLAARQHGAVYPVAPGRLIALAPPTRLAGLRQRRPSSYDGEGGGWSAEACAGALHALGVSTVIRVVDDSDGPAPYDRLGFVECGIEHREVAVTANGRPLFEASLQQADRDGISLGDDISAGLGVSRDGCETAAADRFLRLVDAAPGAVAVHCRDGRRLAGPLLALALMRRHGFTAREAAGWLRVVRPGAIIDGQLEFLCEYRAGLASGGGSTAAGRPAVGLAAADDGDGKQGRLPGSGAADSESPAGTSGAGRTVTRDSTGDIAARGSPAITLDVQAGKLASPSAAPAGAGAGRTPRRVRFDPLAKGAGPAELRARQDAALAAAGPAAERIRQVRSGAEPGPPSPRLRRLRAPLPPVAEPVPPLCCAAPAGGSDALVAKPAAAGQLLAGLCGGRDVPALQALRLPAGGSAGCTPRLRPVRDPPCRPLPCL